MNLIKSLILTAATVFCFGCAAYAAEPDLQVDKNCNTAVPQQPSDGHAAPSAGGELSDSLAKCRGVLRPPPVHDSMAMTPPPTGAKTPVVPPGAVPPQAPQK